MRSRSRSSATSRRSTMLTGFVCLEEVTKRVGASSNTTWKRRRPSFLGALSKDRWVYGVLDRDTLRCYRRRVDVKHNYAPFKTLQLDLPSTLIAERQSIIVKSQNDGLTYRIRVHPSSSSTYLQWVTTLYLARLDSSKLSTATSSTISSEEDSELTKRSKRVTFNEDPFEFSPSGDESLTEEDWRTTADLGELYYSREDYDRFYRESEDVLKKKTSTRSVVRSIVAVIKGK